MKWHGILVVIGPAIGYGIAFIREWSYCNYFGIPSEFIKLDMTNIIIAVVEGIGLVLIVAFLLYVYRYYEKRTKEGLGPIKRRLMMIGLLGTMWVYFGIRYSDWIWWVVGLAGVILFTLLLIVFPFIIHSIRHKKFEGFRKKLEEEDKIPWKDADLFDDINNRIGFPVYPLIFIVFLLFLAPYLGGSLQASNKQDFLIPSTNPNSVVLKIYGDNLVCAPFDAETNIVEKSFFILNVNDEPRPLLELTRIGRLKSPNIHILEPEGNTTQK